MLREVDRIEAGLGHELRSELGYTGCVGEEQRVDDTAFGSARDRDGMTEIQRARLGDGGDLPRGLVVAVTGHEDVRMSEAPRSTEPADAEAVNDRVSREFASLGLAPPAPHEVRKK